jgi:sulfur carrier protein
MTRIEARPREMTVNGQTVVTGAETLAAVVEEQGLGAVKVATALNGDFIPARARAATRVAAGDRIEILTARQGG